MFDKITQTQLVLESKIEKNIQLINKVFDLDYELRVYTKRLNHNYSNFEFDFLEDILEGLELIPYTISFLEDNAAALSKLDEFEQIRIQLEAKKEQILVEKAKNSQKFWNNVPERKPIILTSKNQAGSLQSQNDELTKRKKELDNLQREAAEDLNYVTKLAIDHPSRKTVVPLIERHQKQLTIELHENQALLNIVENNLISEKRKFWEDVVHKLPSTKLVMEEATKVAKTSPSSNSAISASASKPTNPPPSSEVSTTSLPLLHTMVKAKIEELIKLAQQDLNALAPQTHYNYDASRLYQFLEKLQRGLKDMVGEKPSTVVAISKCFENARDKIRVAYAQLLDSIGDLNIQQLVGLTALTTSGELINQILSYVNHLRESGMPVPAILEKATLELQFSYDVNSEKLYKKPIADKIIQQIKALKDKGMTDNSQVILQGGTSRHGILYVIEPSKDGKTFSFNVINTGEGIIYDETLKKNKPTTTDIVYTDLTLDQLTSDFFKQITEMAMNESDIKKVLDFIDKSLRNPIKNNKAKGRTHFVQKKGTCALKCLTSWLHERLGEHYYPFKEFASKQALENLQEGFKEVERMPEIRAHNRWEYFYGVPTKEKAAELQGKMVSASQKVLQKRAEKAAANLKGRHIVNNEGIV